MDSGMRGKGAAPRDVLVCWGRAEGKDSDTGEGPRCCSEGKAAPVSAETAGREDKRRDKGIAVSPIAASWEDRDETTWPLAGKRSLIKDHMAGEIDFISNRV
jgi:hypothetical protein